MTEDAQSQARSNSDYPPPQPRAVDHNYFVVRGFIKDCSSTALCTAHIRISHIPAAHARSRSFAAASGWRSHGSPRTHHEPWDLPVTFVLIPQVFNRFEGLPRATMRNMNTRTSSDVGFISESRPYENLPGGTRTPGNWCQFPTPNIRITGL
jgi:hypothetical protein